MNIENRIDMVLGESQRTPSTKGDYNIFYINGLAMSFRNKFDLIELLKIYKCTNVKDIVKKAFDLLGNPRVYSRVLKLTVDKKGDGDITLK